MAEVGSLASACTESSQVDRVRSVVESDGNLGLRERFTCEWASLKPVSCNVSLDHLPAARLDLEATALSPDPGVRRGVKRTSPECPAKRASPSGTVRTTGCCSIQRRGRGLGKISGKKCYLAVSK